MSLMSLQSNTDTAPTTQLKKDSAATGSDAGPSREQATTAREQAIRLESRGKEGASSHRRDAVGVG